MVSKVKQVVPEGYKQTEVGVIPEDWRILPLIELAKIRSGIAKNSNKIVHNPVLVHYLRVANVQDGYLNLSDMSEISVSREDIAQYALLPGDVLMNEGGDLDKLGRGAIWRGEFKSCIHQNHVFVVRCGSSLCSDYLNVWTGHTAARKYFLVAGKQTTNLASINKTALGQLPIVLPSLPEQTAIATALSDVDALITSLEKLIAKKRAIKTATMQKLLTGKKRLPPFDKTADGKEKGYKQSELGEIPEDWDITSLGSHLNEPPRYGINAAAVKLKGDLPVYLRITDINEDGYFTSSNKVGVNNQFSYLYKLQSDELVFARTGASVGKSYLYDESDGELIYAGFLIKVSPNTVTLNPMYLSQYVKTERYWRWVKVTSMRSGQPGINGVEYAGLEILLPSIEEQSIIAGMLSEMDREIAIIEQRLSKTQKIKQGMMQELLTGRTRLV